MKKISEIMMKVEFTPRWYYKPVGVIAYLLAKARIISGDRFARIVMGCGELKVLK
jgi:hypothetical protein